MTLDTSPASLLVIGAGNLLMGDEGVGIHVLRLLEQQAPIPGVRFLDGGTGGVNLLGELDTATCILFVDATRDAQAVGTLTHLRPGPVADLPVGLSAHDFGVRDLFAAAALLGKLPEVHVFTISVETLRPMCMELSPELASVVPEAVRRVNELVAELIRTCPEGVGG